MRRRIAGLLLAVLTAWLSPAAAEHLFMARSVLPFPEAMSALQEQIRAHGYRVSRVQRVDIGLTRMGYKTDKYRVVFFGRPDEVRTLTARYPQLATYLPLKIAIFAEEQESLLVSADPMEIYDFVDAPEVRAARAAWSRDIMSIFEALRGME